MRKMKTSRPRTAAKRGRMEPTNTRLTDDETRFIEVNRFYAVRIAQGVFRGDRRVFDLRDLVQVAYAAMLDAALAWKRRTGRPASDVRFIKFSGIRIRRACSRFQIENERAVVIKEYQVRNARRGKTTAATRDAALGGRRSVSLARASCRRGVRRGRTGNPIGRRSNVDRGGFGETEQRAVRKALRAAAAVWSGARGAAAELIVAERVPFRKGYQLSAEAIGTLAGGLSGRQVNAIQENLLARAWRSLKRAADPDGEAGGAAADTYTGTPASADDAGSGLGSGISARGVSDARAAAVA